MNENIGVNAGKIWQYLEQNGESKIVRVKREPVSYTHLTLPTSDLV